MSKHTVLFELGCEELPPKSLKNYVMPYMQKQ